MPIALQVRLLWLVGAFFRVPTDGVGWAQLTPNSQTKKRSLQGDRFKGCNVASIFRIEVYTATGTSAGTRWRFAT